MTITMEELVDKTMSQLRSMIDSDGSNRYRHNDILEEAYKKSITIVNKILDNNFKGKFFKYGNLKLDSNIARFTLPEVLTCCCDCPGCYAKKMPYKSVKLFRLSNLIITLYALSDTTFHDKLLEVIHKELDKHKEKCIKLHRAPIFRFHDSGDIFSSSYLQFMIEIVLMNPDIKFYGYTKNREAYSVYKKLKEELGFKNFNIVNSIVENSFMNYFDFIHNFKMEFKKFKDMIKMLRANNKKVFVCNYNLDHLFKENRFGYKTLLGYMLSNNDVISFADGHSVCGECTACCDFEYTVFIKH